MKKCKKILFFNSHHLRTNHLYNESRISVDETWKEISFLYVPFCDTRRTLHAETERQRFLLFLMGRVKEKKNERVRHRTFLICVKKKSNESADTDDRVIIVKESHRLFIHTVLITEPFRLESFIKTPTTSIQWQMKLLNWLKLN